MNHDDKNPWAEERVPAGFASKTADHVLLTRFNVPSAGYEGLVRARDGWLRDRMDLFERYCLPSVRSQSEKQFAWIIYLDPESPSWLKARIQELNDDGIFTPIYRQEVLKEHLLEDLKTVVGSPADLLITSNLDNDDGLAVDFISRVQSFVPDETPAAVYLPQGLVRSDRAIYRHTDPENAFCTVVAQWSDPETCWAEWHNRLGQIMPVIRLGGPPAWLQVVHGNNVSNRIHGVLASPNVFFDAFPGLISDVADPTFSDMVKDHLLLLPGRILREVGRSAVKVLVRFVLGRDAIDGLRLRIAPWIRGLRRTT